MNLSSPSIATLQTTSNLLAMSHTPQDPLAPTLHPTQWFPGWLLSLLSRCLPTAPRYGRSEPRTDTQREGSLPLLSAPRPAPRSETSPYDRLFRQNLTRVIRHPVSDSICFVTLVFFHGTVRVPVLLRKDSLYLLVRCIQHI